MLIKGSTEPAHIIYIAMNSQPTPPLVLALCHCRSSFRQLLRPGNHREIQLTLCRGPNAHHSVDDKDKQPSSPGV